MLERRIKPTKGVWNGYGREGILVLDGVSRKSLFEEVTLTVSFKRNKNETHAPFTTYTGEPIYQYLFHGVII